MILRTALLSFTLQVCLVNAYSQDKIKTDSSRVKTIRVDPLNALGAKASDVFSEINYIPLETTKASLFGTIDQLEVTASHFIIFDKNTNSILIFNSDGKFHKRINGGDSSVDFGKRIREFNFNKWTNEISFQRVSGKSTTYYDLNGNKLREISRQSTGYFPSSYKYIGPDLVVFTNQYSSSNNANADDNFLIYYLKKNFSVLTAKAIPYYNIDRKQVSSDMLSASTGPFFRSGIDTVLYYTKPYDYNIFKLSPNKVEEVFHLMFPAANSLPNDFLMNKLLDGKRTEYITKNENVIFSLSNLYTLENLLLFKVNVYGTNFKNANLIYNFEQGTLLSYNKIQTDQSSFFLPIADGYNFEETGIAFCDGQNIYTQFSAGEIFKAKSDNEAKKINYPDPLKIFFSKGSKEDNPVILKIKLKK